MALKYYMKPDSNTPPAYVYVVGDDSDSLWDADKCIEVDPQPSCAHIYNIQAKEWQIDEIRFMCNLRHLRDNELRRTDKYVLPDYPISAEDLVVAKQYRQDLRDCPDEAVLADRVLPDCPAVCNS